MYHISTWTLSFIKSKFPKIPEAFMSLHGIYLGLQVVPTWTFWDKGPEHKPLSSRALIMRALRRWTPPQFTEKAKFRADARPTVFEDHISRRMSRSVSC